MGFSDYLLDCSVRLLPVVGIILFGYNAYLEVVKNKNPVESSFSLAVFATFLVSVVSVGCADRLAKGTNEKKLKTISVVVSLFLLIAAAFLLRVWMVVPKEMEWVVVAACGVPAFAGLSLLSIYWGLVKKGN